MQFRKRIRSQIRVGTFAVVFIVLIVAIAGLLTVGKFRALTKSIRDRAYELPLSAKLNYEIGNLQVVWANNLPSRNDQFKGIESSLWSTEFDMAFNAVGKALREYESQLHSESEHESRLADNSLELKSVAKMKADLSWLTSNRFGNDFLDANHRYLVEARLTMLRDESRKLPLHMQQRMEQFSISARNDYHRWFRNVTLLAIVGILIILWLMSQFRSRIFRPLDNLVCGSRRVASGDFDYRIPTESDDEIAELAYAMNLMTEKFHNIKSDLDDQVIERTREVVRSEQLASVGYMAAGVAHEINNPLASIAWSAESLESRLRDILSPTGEVSKEVRDQEIVDMKKYLKRIQDEAFRCKGITSGLLDFARLGDARKVSTELVPLVEQVVDMLRPLSRYREKEIVVRCAARVQALANPQELKQVVLNLVTNALDSIDVGGRVTIELEQDNQHARLVVTDDGCGMENDVLQNIFEPFFTRRRDGQGTGLGLSITYRIIEEHGGSIRPESQGPGHGSRFTVSLPVVNHDRQELKAA